MERSLLNNDDVFDMEIKRLFSSSNDEILRQTKSLTPQEQYECFLTYICTHYFDDNTHVVIRTFFKDIVRDASIMESSFVLSHLQDVARVTNLMMFQVFVPQPIWNQMFPDTTSYTFPTLLCDTDGLPSGQSCPFAAFDHFRLQRVVGTQQCNYSWNGDDVTPQSMDAELERAVVDTNSTCFMIDLLPFKNGCFTNQLCSVYPERVKDYPVLYDTLYWTDHLLKFFYRIFLQVMIVQRTDDEIMIDNYLLGVRPSIGNAEQHCYKVANLTFRQGFSEIVGAVRRFSSANPSTTELRQSFFDFKRQHSSATDVKVLMLYEIVEFTAETRDDGSVDVRLLALRPNAVVSASCGPLPLFLASFKQFLDDHYEDLSRAFSLYQRLENMFRLCAMVMIKDRFDKTGCVDTFTVPEQISGDCVLIGSGIFPDSILCKGAQKVTPREFRRVAPAHCRETFDNGGLLCAFAPKLKIRDCYETNLKTFHDCLAAEEQQEDKTD